MTTTSRLILLLSLLQSRRDWPGGVLAERLEISHRTVRRDVDRLREMGYRIRATKGPDGGYRLDAGSELPPLLFDDDQVIAVTIALQAAAATGAGIGEDAVRALTTVRQVMPQRLRHRLDAVTFSTVEAPDHEVDTEVLVTLSGAVRAREVIRFDYGDERRQAEPHHLVARQGRWYLVAWDLDREDWRTFRVDRLTPHIPTGPRFVPRELPAAGVEDFVTARFRGAAHGTAWPCLGSVIVSLPASDVLAFAGDGTVEDLGPDRCRLDSGAWSWIALAASLGRFDADIEVIGPPALADAFGVLAARYAAASGR